MGNEGKVVVLVNRRFVLGRRRNCVDGRSEAEEVVAVVIGVGRWWKAAGFYELRFKKTRHSTFK